MKHKEIVLNLLKKEPHAVIATVDESGNPESALIGFGQTDELLLIIGTSNLSRKYKNIKNNPHVAVVIGGWKDHITLQYEGKAVELSGEEKEALSEIYLMKVPESRKYKLLPDQCYFKIIPKWIRCTGYSKEEGIFEINL
jgi:pyridoxine/pyridoxamine 5'-phosphate oxidase